MKLAEQIRIKIQNNTFPCNRPITASFGIAEIETNMDEKTLIDKADKALYKAKNNGRNQVVQG